MMSVQSNTEKEWGDKIPKLFWRGRDSRKERLDLISIGRKHSNLINASLTNFFFFRDQEHVYGPKEQHVSFFRFFDVITSISIYADNLLNYGIFCVFLQYKYQLSIDGTVAAYRYPFLLGGDSVVFKTDSPYIEHFYQDLTPWTHYIPVQGDLKDLVKKIKWAMGNDDKVKKIGRAGSEYARNNLMPLNIFCYHGLLLEVKLSVIIDGTYYVTKYVIKPTALDKTLKKSSRSLRRDGASFGESCEQGQRKL